MWVPTRLVVSTTHQTWGDFQDHRQDTLLEIAQGLADATNLDAFTTRLFTDEINLTHMPAWAGPVYEVAANGNHRVHIAGMLELPWLATTVTYEKPPPVWQSWSMSSVESKWARTRWSEKWARQRQSLIEGLIRRGIVEGEFDDSQDLFNRRLHCTKLPAPWLIRAPGLAAAGNAYYEALYPGALAALGIPVEVGTDPTNGTGLRKQLASLLHPGLLHHTVDLTETWRRPRQRVRLFVHACGQACVCADLARSGDGRVEEVG